MEKNLQKSSIQDQSEEDTFLWQQMTALRRTEKQRKEEIIFKCLFLFNSEIFNNLILCVYYIYYYNVFCFRSFIYFV